MKFEVFNVVFLKKESLIKTLEKIFPQNNQMVVNIVFVSKKQIKDLNREFRDEDEETDVISFKLDGNISEVYICSDYIREEIETVRMIIHGVLHIQGYEHKGYFEGDVTKEKMFEIQERLLEQFYDILEK